MYIDTISNAGRYDVKLNSIGGFIDSSSAENPNIYAKGIYLNTSNGSIGTYSDELDLYSNYNTSGGTVSAYAYGYINLAQYAEIFILILFPMQEDIILKFLLYQAF